MRDLLFCRDHNKKLRINTHVRLLSSRISYFDFTDGHIHVCIFDRLIARLILRSGNSRSYAFTLLYNILHFENKKIYIHKNIYIYIAACVMKNDFLKKLSIISKTDHQKRLIPEREGEKGMRRMKI